MRNGGFLTPIRLRSQKKKNRGRTRDGRRIFWVNSVLRKTYPAQLSSQTTGAACMSPSRRASGATPHPARSATRSRCSTSAWESPPSRPVCPYKRRDRVSQNSPKDLQHQDLNMSIHSLFVSPSACAATLSCRGIYGPSHHALPCTCYCRTARRCWVYIVDQQLPSRPRRAAEKI